MMQSGRPNQDVEAGFTKKHCTFLCCVEYNVFLQSFVISKTSLAKGNFLVRIKFLSETQNFSRIPLLPDTGGYLYGVPMGRSNKITFLLPANCYYEINYMAES